jgi:putative acetyltransferase
VIVRRETAADVAAIRSLQQRAFAVAAHSSGTEADIIDALRAGPDWIESLSLVAEIDGVIVGHVVCSRGHIGDHPAVGLGPIGVEPDRHRTGIGSTLMHAVIAAADARNEPAVALLGDPGYYHRFGFTPAHQHGVTPPDPQWGDYFQLRPLSAWQPGLTGTFRYAAAFAGA